MIEPVYTEAAFQRQALTSKIEAAKRLYNICRDMDIEETLELILSAETEEEEEFFSLLSDFILQRKQREAIARKEF